ncbi:DUF4232 domain-containing protein [Streptomyces sp. NBC_00638]|uniref:DUF4232 domain-containing protein n=1 Tax=unclassified Streptomyces TaxID=2593676 RepID=UPI002252796F|nr:DUF4232 domain-containing protein [Streptomyces sp. NBC_00638]MCX5001158.1 DUF4232 domain-containing protein [Streptomyces sp. NBC_00638]
MAYAARSRRTTAALAALSLGLLALTACNGDSEKDTTAPGAQASPSASKDKGAGSSSPTASPGGSGSGGGGKSSASPSTPPSSEPGSDDDQDGGVGMCETTDLSYNVTVASKPVNHALLTAANKGSDPCLLAANELVLTIPGLDGAAGRMGPDGKDWILKPGEKAYTGILFSRADTAGGKSVDKVEIALTASESPTTVSINGGPVTVNDMQVTTFFGTAEDALTY